MGEIVAANPVSNANDGVLAPAKPSAITPAGSAGATSNFAPMRAVSLLWPFDTLLGDVSKTAMAVPSMMTESERKFLYGLAARYYTGAGVILDAGLFMGASTVCFGEGLRANANYADIKRSREKPIVSLERGIVNPGMPAFFDRHKIEFSGAVGDSFEPVLRRNIASVESDVDLRVGDILERGKVDDKIEILFLDVIKNVQIARFVMSEYMPRLIPNRSIVLQQDYFIDLLPFIKTYQEALSAHFTYVGEVGPMAAFLCTSTPDGSIFKPDVTLDEANQLELADVALRRSIDPSRRFLMALSKMRLIKKIQGADAAVAYLANVESEFSEVLTAAQRPGRIHDAWVAARQAAVAPPPARKPRA